MSVPAALSTLGLAQGGGADNAFPLLLVQEGWVLTAWGTQFSASLSDSILMLRPL